MKVLKVAAVIDRLPEVIEYIEEELQRAGCPDAERTLVTMASEEIYVNIASYAYQEKEGNVEISCEKAIGPEGIKISFTDQGIPYNPLLHESPDITLPASQRQAGGLGIFMVKQFMDNVIYNYQDGHNCLVIEKFW